MKTSKTKRMLLVEDDELYGELLKESLGPMVELRWAKSEDEARAAWSQPFDLVVFDRNVARSKHTGVEMALELRQANDELPIVVHSFFAERAERLMLHDHGIVTCDKGTDLDAILLCVEAYLGDGAVCTRSPKLATQPWKDLSLRQCCAVIWRAAEGRLTAAQTRVLGAALVLEPAAQREVLKIAESTRQTHLRAIAKKLDAPLRDVLGAIERSLENATATRADELEKKVLGLERELAIQGRALRQSETELEQLRIALARAEARLGEDVDGAADTPMTGADEKRNLH